jgi:hypothetical protein
MSDDIIVGIRTQFICLSLKSDLTELEVVMIVVAYTNQLLLHKNQLQSLKELLGNES